MGYYVEVPEPKGKAQQLVDSYGAEILKRMPARFEDVPEGKALICVVDNGPFEAAGLCCSAEEFESFDAPDEAGPEVEEGKGPGGIPAFTVRSSYQAQGLQRPRTWVLMDKAQAHELAGYSNGG